MDYALKLHDAAVKMAAAHSLMQDVAEELGYATEDVSAGIWHETTFILGVLSEEKLLPKHEINKIFIDVHSILYPDDDDELVHEDDGPIQAERLAALEKKVKALDANQKNIMPYVRELEEWLTAGEG